MIKRVVLYVRVSTQEQATEGYSIQEQIDRLNKYCEAHGWILVETYVDPGFSGTNTNRPALQKLLRDIPFGGFDTVLVYKLDRLSRSQKDTMQLIEDKFLANNIEFISMSENFDTGTPFGRAMIGILSVFAQLERDQIRERMGMGKLARAKEGKWNGGSTVPIGYTYDVQGGRLHIDEYEAMQVREIFALFLKGMQYRSISNYLDRKGYTYTGRSGHTGHWDPKNIKYVLTNRLYVGDIRYGGQWYKGDQPPIIDEDTFNRAQELFAQRGIKNAKFKKKRQGQTTFLGGLIYCKQCGARYHRQLGRSWKGREAPIYYNCYSRSKKVPRMIKDPTCMNKSWRTEELDNVVFETIQRLALDPNYFAEIQRSENAGAHSSEKIDILKKEIAKIDSQISRFLDLYGLGQFSIEQVSGKVEPLTEQKKSLEHELDELSSEVGILSNSEARKVIQSFGEVLERGDFDEIRLVIDTLIRYIELDEEEVIIHWRFV